MHAADYVVVAPTNSVEPACRWGWRLLCVEVHGTSEGSPRMLGRGRVVSGMAAASGASVRNLLKSWRERESTMPLATPST